MALVLPSLCRIVQGRMVKLRIGISVLRLIPFNVRGIISTPMWTGHRATTTSTPKAWPDVLNLNDEINEPLMLETWERNRETANSKDRDIGSSRNSSTPQWEVSRSLGAVVRKLSL